MAVIEVHGVTKRFRRHGSPALLRDRLGGLLRRSAPQDAIYAVRNVSFKVERGESVGLIGANGAGKSTLLSLVTGVVPPDEGTVKVNGRITALLDLGSGLHPELTGAENVFFYAAVLGLSEKETRTRYAAIVEFSELGDFIREPVRTYSSGMILRLAFSIAAHADPAILIVDEVLIVGDKHFQEKSQAKVQELRRAGVTMLCVSHNASMLETFCDRALWLKRGELILDGPAAEVQRRYKADDVSTQAATSGPTVR